MNYKRHELDYWFKPIDEIFEDFKEETLDYDLKKCRRIFRDLGGSVLFVAHLDTVLPPKLIKRTKGRIYGQGLDDRLGCHIAYNLSMELGADLLLTDLEESAETTMFFQELKDYNWIVEFDRAGHDVVTYYLSSKVFDTELSKFFTIGVGSFTDICWADTTACCFNLGIGYRNAHAADSYAQKGHMNTQIRLFKQFYNKNKDIKFVQDDAAKGNYRYDYMDYERSRNYLREGYDGECEFCGLPAVWCHSHLLCEDCLEEMVYGVNPKLYAEDSYHWWDKMEGK